RDARRGFPLVQPRPPALLEFRRQPALLSGQEPVCIDSRFQSISKLCTTTVKRPRLKPELQRHAERAGYYPGKSAASSGCGRGITSARISFPPRRSTVALPVATAVCTAATSPLTTIVTYAAPIFSFPTSDTFDDLSMSSVACSAATSPCVSSN